MLKPIGITEGHYECRSLDETLPIFTDLLAAEVIERSDKQAVVKHPKTNLTATIMDFASPTPRRFRKRASTSRLTRSSIKSGA